MIESYLFTPKKGLPVEKSNRFSWASDFLPPAHSFNPNLTIIVGPNGSGKSTLLSMLAAGTLSERCGYPVLDRPTMEKEFEILGDAFLLEGLSVTHDGQILYCSSTRFSEPAGNQDSFEDLLHGLIKNRLTKYSSSGESVLYRITFAMQLITYLLDPDNFFDLDKVVEKRLRRYKRTLSNVEIQQIREEELKRHEEKGKIPKPKMPTFEDRTQGVAYNDVWMKRRQRLLDYYQENKKLDPVKPTLLLDEPDSHLSIPIQNRIWKILTHEKVLSHYQIIVATHHILPIVWLRQGKLSRDNFIELKKGYLDELIQENSKLFI